MFSIKLEEKSYKMSFKALPVKKEQSKNQQGAQCALGQIGLMKQAPRIFFLN